VVIRGPRELSVPEPRIRESHRPNHAAGYGMMNSGTHAMSTTAAGVSLEKYLNTVYRPDRDYVDGRLEKRNAGKWDHAEL
jgi:hypothetical protein